MKTRRPDPGGAHSTADSVPHARLLPELALIVACKIAVVFTLWALFFNPSKRPQQSPESVADGVLGSSETSHVAQETPVAIPTPSTP